MNLDTGTPTGKLMLNLLGAIAEFERELMLERQREGIAKAKSEGKYQGRQPTARRKSGEVMRLGRREVCQRHRQGARNQPSQRFPHPGRKRSCYRWTIGVQTSGAAPQVLADFFSL
jgi:site-specific DNA-cytosine methylase